MRGRGRHADGTPGSGDRRGGALRPSLRAGPRRAADLARPDRRYRRDRRYWQDGRRGRRRRPRRPPRGGPGHGRRQRRPRFPPLPRRRGTARPGPVRDPARPARLRAPRRRADLPHRQQGRRDRRPRRRPPGRARPQPRRPRSLRHVLPTARRPPRLGADRRRLRPGRLRPARRRPLRPALLPGPRQGCQGSHPGPGRPLAHVQEAAPRGRPGLRPRLRAAGRRGPAVLHDAQQRPRSGCPAGRARRAEAEFHGGLVRHLPRRRLRHPASGSRRTDGPGLGGRPRPAPRLVPQQPRPVGRLRAPLVRLPRLGGPAPRHVRPRRHPGGRAGELRARAGRGGPYSGGRGRRHRRAAGRLPPDRVLRRRVAGPGGGPRGLPARRSRAADRPGRPGPGGGGRGGERDGGVHGGAVQRRLLARGLGDLGPRQHRAGAQGPVRDLGQRLPEPPVRLVAGTGAAAAGGGRGAAGAAAGDPGGRGGAGRGDPVPGRAGTAAAARRRGFAGDGDGGRLPRSGRRTQRLRGPARGAVPADGRHPGWRVTCAPHPEPAPVSLDDRAASAHRALLPPVV